MKERYTFRSSHSGDWVTTLEEYRGFTIWLNKRHKQRWWQVSAFNNDIQEYDEAHVDGTWCRSSVSAKREIFLLKWKIDGIMAKRIAREI